MNEFVGAVFVLLILLALFMLFRNAMLWYWKVNESVELLKSINEKLALLVDKKS